MMQIFQPYLNEYEIRFIHAFGLRYYYYYYRYLLHHAMTRAGGVYTCAALTVTIVLQ